MRLYILNHVFYPIHRTPEVNRKIQLGVPSKVSPIDRIRTLIYLKLANR